MSEFELEAHDDLPTVVDNTGKKCEFEVPRPCGAEADVSVWADLGVARHRWTEWRLLCSDHFDPTELTYYQHPLALSESGREVLEFSS